MLGMRPPILSVSPALMDYFDSITMVIEPAYQLNTHRSVPIPISQ